MINKTIFLILDLAEVSDIKTGRTLSDSDDSDKDVGARQLVSFNQYPSYTSVSPPAATADEADSPPDPAREFLISNKKEPIYNEFAAKMMVFINIPYSFDVSDEGCCFTLTSLSIRGG